MLLHGKRGLAAALILSLTLSLGLPALAADPLAGGGFAQVAISASGSDSPTLKLQLDLYRRDSSGAFAKAEAMSHTTPVNRLTKDMKFELIPQAQQVTLTVDYLTDLNGDGVYELLSGQDSPVGDVLTAAGALAGASSGVSTQLTPGCEYTLTGQMLLDRGQAVLQDRTAPGSASYLTGFSGLSASPDSILYMVTIIYDSPTDGREYEQCYYLQLYDQLPAPSAADYLDVPKDAWYYDAVDYVVSHGLLSGSSRSIFSPGLQLTRAMLAQTLYNIAGLPESPLGHFTDVADSDWYSAAVSWVYSEQIMAGTSAQLFAPNRTLTRQEMAVTMYLYVQKQGVSTQQRADLSVYADQGDIASWGQEAMEWAVATGLLAGRAAGDTQILDPNGTVSRADFSAVLRTLCQKVLA